MIVLQVQQIFTLRQFDFLQLQTFISRLIITFLYQYIFLISIYIMIRRILYNSNLQVAVRQTRSKARSM